jgi:transposase InsO family protein
MKQREIKSLYIKPGSPWENGHIESFHDKLRDECLNREVFGSILEAKVVVESWRMEYNQQRPHSSLGYQTPEEFAACALTTLRPTASAASERPVNNINPRTELYF